MLQGTAGVEHYALANECSYRREAFGASLFDSRTHAVSFFDHGAAFCLEAFFDPIDLSAARERVSKFYLDKQSVNSYLDDLIASGILVSTSRAHPSEQRFYVDRVDFQDTHLVAPLALEFELTLRCRRVCTYCAYDSRPSVNPSGEMGGDDYLEAFKAARDSGVFYLRFTGGDPLLRTDAIEIISLASDMGFSVAVASDLTMLSDVQVSGLARLKRLTVVQTTLDGPDAASADMLRGNGNYRAVLAGIQRLRAAGVPVMVGTVLTKHNKSRIYEIAKVLSAFDVSYCVSPLYSAGRGRSLSEIIPSDSDLAEAYEQFAQAVTDGLVDPADPGWNAIARDAHPTIREKLWKSQPWLIRSPDRILRVNPYGHCYAGIQAKEFLADDVYVGKLSAESLDTIWNGSPTLNMLRRSATSNSYYGSVIDSQQPGSA